MSNQKITPTESVNGIVVLNKPAGDSSNQILQKVKRLFNAKKAGHTGTLDPIATGMLVITLGHGTKINSHLLEADKVYQVTMQLGQTRTTGDIDGEIVAEADIPTLNTKLIESKLSKYRGLIEQTPPMYSALKHEGKPLYYYARQGIHIERKSRSVKIYALDLIAFSKDQITLKIHCSKGTYVRTIVEDLGQDLGCGAYVKKLHRDWLSPFEQSPTVTLAELERLSKAQRLEKLLPIDFIFADWPALTLSKEQASELDFGRSFAIDFPDSNDVRVYTDDHLFWGIGRVLEGRFSIRRRMID